MRIEPAPDRYLYPQIEYAAVPDSTVETMCSGTLYATSPYVRKLRRDVLIIDGHPYEPEGVLQHDLWRTPRTYRSGREAAA